MSLTNAMLAGFTGINSNQTTVNTVGDNLANVNTTAFKGQRTLFETLMYRTITEGTEPGGNSGGTLPYQIGTGSSVAALQRNFTSGALEPTGIQSDLALDGIGFFVVADAEGNVAYTRDGAFHLDADQVMVSTNGDPLQVYAADTAGAIDTSTLTNLTIPLGTASAAVATTNVVMDGSLDGGADVAATGAVLASDALLTSGGTAATATTALTSLVDANGLARFADGDTITINAGKGESGMLPTETFVVGTDGSTLGDLATFLERVLRIDTSDGTSGVTIADGTNATAGSLVVTSNPGDVNAIRLSDSAIQVSGATNGTAMSFTTQTEATGEGATTSFTVYDSLGNPLEVRVRTVLESRSDAGSTWRFYAETAGADLEGQLLGTGTISFDANGQFVAATDTTLSIDRAAAGAVSPLTFDLDFRGLTGVTSPDGESQLLMESHDGKPAGTMTGYDIAEDGTVTAVYDNELREVLGQVAVARFTNEEGLVATGENRYLEGPDSGAATLTVAGTDGTGDVRSYHLEASNVEVTREFINLISAQTGITAASRVVRSADDMLQQLLLLAR